MHSVGAPAGALGVGQKQPALTEAQRNAEALFQSKTISEIREIEVRTRKDIEQKKLQLRNLVGDSYRDLIDSADKILSISKNTTTILNNVRNIQDAFSGLAHNFTSSDALLNEKRDSLTKHEELYAVGSRVKYLVDTPELIWGCLDAKRYLDAARRYLRAEHVHDLLQPASGASQGGVAAGVLARFPLLRHHWPTVTKFKTQVMDAVQAALSGERQLSTDAAADLLAAMASLQGADSGALLQTFLAARRSMVGQVVAAAAAASAAPAAEGEVLGPAAASATAAEVLSSVAQAVQLTVAQVGELFLPSGRGADASCLLQQRCREDEADYSELLFGGRSSSAAAPQQQQGGAKDAGGASAPEAEAWKRTNRAVVERLAALSSGQVEHACAGWLRAVAEDFSAACGPLLSGLTTAVSLVQVEAQVRAAIADWQHPGAAAGGAAASGKVQPGGAAKRARTGRTVASSALGSATSASGVIAPAGSLGRHGHGHGHNHAHVQGHGHGVSDASPNLGSWEAVCEWVVGRQLNLWQEVFHAPFVARSRELIEEGFAALGRSLEGPLDACLAAAAAAEPEPAGCILTRTWPLEGWEGGVGTAAAGVDGAGRYAAASRSAELRGEGAVGEAGVAGAGGKVGGKAVDRSYRQQVAAMQRKFDEDMLAMLQAVLLLVGTADAASLPSAVHSTPVSHAASAASLSRAASEAVATAAGGGSGQLRGASSVHAATIRRDMQGSRAAELEPFVQSRCTELVNAIASRLQSRLEALGAPRDGPAGAATAEQVVLLGRLASALATDSKYLPVMLGPPEGWKPATTAAAVAAAAGGAAIGAALGGSSRTGAGRFGVGARGAAANARLAGVLERLRAAAAAAYRSWATWTAGSLAAELRALLLADDLLTSNVVPLSWQETVITSEAENALAEPVADMRFSLPAAPSASALLFLSAACAEVRRAGDHRIAPEALQLLEWELSRAATATYSQLLQPGGALSARGVSEKGVLQLLMDVRFVRDVLVGGRPVGTRPTGQAVGGAGAGVSGGLHPSGSGGALPGAASAGGLLPGVGGELADPALAAALAERKREAAALEQMLQDFLDPIDWATYESYLWANVARYFGRCAILFGALIQLQRAHPEAGATGAAAGAAKSGATGGTQDLNPLNVLPVASRFHYLPISAPAANLSSQAALAAAAGSGAAAAAGGLGGSRAQGRSSLSSLSRAVSGVGLGGPRELPDNYSFADLGSALSGRGRGAGGAEEGAGGDVSGGGAGAGAASVGAAALSALQARLQVGTGSLGTLGSMLGDKAAEVTAMAQQRFGDFGDYLPTSALGSAAGGLLSSLTKNVVKK